MIGSLPVAIGSLGLLVVVVAEPIDFQHTRARPVCIDEIKNLSGQSNSTQEFSNLES